MLIYMAGHEGRGIGLWAKAATYLLQDSGEDTYQANRSLGPPDDSRDFSDAATLDVIEEEIKTGIRHFSDILENSRDSRDRMDRILRATWNRRVQLKS